MKTVSAIIKTVVIFSIFMILLLALSVYLLLPKTLDAQRYASFVNKNSTKLAEIAEACPVHLHAEALFKGAAQTG